MRLTVLGKSPSWQDAGGACSGYLIREDGEGGARLLLDCGSGVFGKLRAHCDYVDLDAVVITHLHADHFFDLMPLACALTYAPRQQPVPVDRWPGTQTPARPELHVPAGGSETLRNLCRVSGMFEDLIDKAFRVREYAVGEELAIGAMRVTFHEVPHYVPTCAVRVSDGNGRALAYGADHSPTHALDDFATDVDLLMLEATLPRPERTGVRGHLTPSEAGEHATRANARRLVLTHISDELGADWALDQARRSFAGPVEVARQDAVYEL